ncbi:glycoside hydrolase family 3 protein [Cyanobacterium sp. IPPAS B-1200]|uniref:glycoside hydrolase family 3 protein n=1 Tax=Cyanobacterium sp. IPPAS B-1200 TaxID=1562720 RepID=UPI00085250E0|nr:glycoside hydrolase family 3 N-terminal domain-containing protein [Cyanobacterium sp. IPPAS B-1200]OEJ79378.1 beta-glucosidase [Cyanobacterium sp. IPPAS B-1200]
MKNLSLKEKIGQLIVVRTTGYLFDHQIRYPAWEANQQQLQTWLWEYNIGGVILLGGSCAEIAQRTKQLNQWAKTPLLVAADIEEGVGQRFTGASWFPPPMALAQIAQDDLELAKKYAEEMGKITAKEALCMGVNWILAPVVDVNNNPDNPVINVRAFGDNPEVVKELSSAFIRGTQSYPILNGAKHFPGHGDTSTDSHLDLPVISHSQARLQDIELVPFQGAIALNVDAIMTAHLLVSAYDNQNPATLSHRILTEELRHNMGFEGLIVTDALIMGGVAKYAPPEKIAVKALQAGADILLMPENPLVAIHSIIEAVEKGEISESRIDESLQRVSKAKEKLFKSQQSFSFAEISSNESQQVINKILFKSNQISALNPIKKVGEGINLVVVDDLLNCDFLDRQTPSITIPDSFGYHAQVFDQRNLYMWENQPISKPFILQVFVRGNPFRGTAGLSAIALKTYEQILKNPHLQGIMVYGSPYVLDWFKNQIPTRIPWGFSYGQMAIAQQTICNGIFQISANLDITKGNFL